MALLVLSGLLSLLRALFPSVAEAAADSLAVAVVHVPMWKSVVHTLWNIATPVAYAVALQSGTKSTIEWANLGWSILHPPKK